MARLPGRHVWLSGLFVHDCLVVAITNILGDAVCVVEIPVRPAIGLDDFGNGVHHDATKLLQGIPVTIGAPVGEFTIGLVQRLTHSLKRSVDME